MEESEKTTTIAVDIMGSDKGPVEIIEGVALAAKNLAGNERLILVGDGPMISSELVRLKLNNNSKITVENASQVVEMSEKPMQAYRAKKDSSMIKAIGLVKENKADGVLSCGNTGCLMASGTLMLRPMSGIDRPALASVIPTIGSYFVLVDVGANPESTYRNIVHNAVLGSQYFASTFQCKHQPRVGLLTIGTEEGKGNELVHRANEDLKKIHGEINYCGLIEGFQLFDGNIDVVLCDGFTGNILIKTMEALASKLKKYIKKELFKNPLRILGAIFAGGAFNDIKKTLNPDKFSGAPLLGLNGTIIKAHGSSNRIAIASALEVAFRIAASGNSDNLQTKIDKVNTLIEE